MLIITLSLTWLHFHQSVDFDTIFTNNALICHDTRHFATATAAADPAAFHIDDGGGECRIQ